MVLFITRKYPPSRGGMETFSFFLFEEFEGKKKLLHHGHGKGAAWWAVPTLAVHALFWLRRAHTIHLGDLVCAPIARFLRLFTKKPIVVTVHALELTHKNAFLERIINSSLSSITHFVAVSDFTARLLHERGIPSEKISVIPHGIQQPFILPPKGARERVCALANLSSTECSTRPLLLTVGRLVKRKGVAWCIANVLPQLQELDPLYLVVGNGPDRIFIEQAIREKRMEKNVVLLGGVDQSTLQDLYAGADIFIMPNIHVPHDAEGFGFAGIEAAIAGLPVVTSRLEGIPMAIHDGENGTLVEPEDVKAYVHVIKEWITNPGQRIEAGERAQQYTENEFQWEEVAKRYRGLFESLKQSTT